MIFLTQAPTLHSWDSAFATSQPTLLILRSNVVLLSFAATSTADFVGISSKVRGIPPQLSFLQHVACRSG
jgi:hypothetical protein